jgi:hypothetical protein
MEYSKANIKSPRLLVLLTLLLGFCFLMLYAGFESQNLTIIIVPILILLFFTFIILRGILGKVIISEKGIEYRFGPKYKYIEWSKVKAIGVYRVSRYDFVVLDRDKYEKVSIWGQKFIYVSEYQDYFPNSFKKPKEGYIDFNYRKEAFEEIEKMIKKASTQQRV